MIVPSHLTPILRADHFRPFRYIDMRIALPGARDLFDVIRVEQHEAVIHARNAISSVDVDSSVAASRAFNFLDFVRKYSHSAFACDRDLQAVITVIESLAVLTEYQAFIALFDITWPCAITFSR